MRRFAGNPPHSLPLVIWRHGAAHRGLEIEFVRVTDGAGGTYALNAEEPYGVWGR
jgi:hypothetical protein